MMLVEFSVENYLSFKDKVTFSMVASDDTIHDDANVATLPNGKRLLKSAVIYGANASGKSNLLKAMSFMGEFVYFAHSKRPKDPIDVISFKLDPLCADKPSRFDIIFYNDGVKYAYGFAATRKTVIEEYLHIFHDDQDESNNIFTRTLIDGRYVYDADEKFIEIRQFDTTNQLYMPTAALLNGEKFTGIYTFFAYLYIYTSDPLPSISQREYFGTGGENALLNWNKAVEWVKEIDVRISNIQAPQNIIDREDFEKLQDRINSTQKVINHDGTQSEVSFSFFKEESSGTQAFFAIALAVIEKMQQGEIFIADEINKSLHPLLASHIVSLFHDVKDNFMNSQLIFTTHDTNLLDLDLFRRDQIWFAKKDHKTGVSDIYSLCEFEANKDSSDEFVDIKKSYLLGIYGAIPFIGGGHDE